MFESVAGGVEMNFKPTEKLLKQLRKYQEIDTFSRPDNLYWPKEIKDYLLEEKGLVVSQFDTAIGGRMSMPVTQHEDSIDADVSVVWFPCVYGKIVFVHGENSRQRTVLGGELFIFDHRMPHSVSPATNRGAKTTGIYYYMAQGFNKVVKEEVV